MRLPRTGLAARVSSWRATLSRRPKALAADERGITSVEFAMVSMPFIGITFAIVETAMMLFSNQALDTALQDSARQIMTGEVQTGGISQSAFKNNICARMPALVKCTTGLYVDVRSFNATAPAPVKPINSGAFDPSSFIFQPGCPSQVVVVRAAIEYPVYVSLLGNGLKELGNGKRVLMSSVSFRNEPYVMPTPIPGC